MGNIQYFRVEPGQLKVSNHSLIVPSSGSLHSHNDNACYMLAWWLRRKLGFLFAPSMGRSADLHYTQVPEGNEILSLNGPRSLRYLELPGVTSNSSLHPILPRSH